MDIELAQVFTLTTGAAVTFCPTTTDGDKAEIHLPVSTCCAVNVVLQIREGSTNMDQAPVEVNVFSRINTPLAYKNNVAPDTPPVPVTVDEYGVVAFIAGVALVAAQVPTTK